ncbi:CRPV-203 [Crowpox virus]|nr:CRPV-203 [Crowpox virus]
MMTKVLFIGSRKKTSYKNIFRRKLYLWFIRRFPL